MDNKIRRRFESPSFRKKLSIGAGIALYAYILYSLIRTGSYVLPDDPLFFFTSDAFECFVTATLGVVFYYTCLKGPYIMRKILGFIFSLALLLGLAYAKVIRRDSPLTTELEELTSYVGLMILFIALIYFIDNIHLILNNAHHRTEEALKKAELQLMKHQFQPHFVYNALNTIYSMSLQDHNQTSDSILKLSSMMRYLTDDTSTQRVKLSGEVKFIRDYLEIARMRFGDDIDIKMYVEGKMEGKFIDPLLLITPVENALKHGYYTSDKNNSIRVNCSVDDDTLELYVENSIENKPSELTSLRQGTGLSMLKKRLDLLYPKQYNMDHGAKDGRYVFNLKLKLHET